MNLKKNKILVAMSGGVDSSVTALLLKQAGYEIIGATMKLWDTPKDEPQRHTSCCSVEDITDARRVADQIGIPFFVINSKEAFRESVVNPFVQEYLAGRTPNPCALCNQKVKFDFLFQKAFELGAYYVATGHYAKKGWDEAKKEWQLFKGEDPFKDQSYFLFGMNQDQLEHTLFPIGHLKKEAVRSIAREHGLKTSEKPDSQEICFVPGKNHGGFISKYAPHALSPRGNFVDEKGNVLGEHEGIYHYTVGQRRGTQVAAGNRVYVKSIDPKTHTILMTEESQLYQSSLIAKRLRWVRKISDGEQVQARIRYRHTGSTAILRITGSDEVQVQFEEPQRAITPGQAVVFYHGEEVLGGGWIERGID